MERLQVTLDEGTAGALAAQAKRHGTSRATFARTLIREALDARERVERRRRLARDYAAARSDAAELVEVEAAQLGLLDEDLAPRPS